MPVTTEGLRLQSRSPILRGAVELLSSMRFAIALLTLICIASIIGTVLQQQQPMGNYLNQFGPFWMEVFQAAGLYSVYSAWWFLLILAFLVLSTSLCVARSTPKILADLKVFKENIREQSLDAFALRAKAQLTEDVEVATQRVARMLSADGWKVKLQQRETSEGLGWMVAAKTGAGNKLGYIAAHSAIVLVCLGGLLDGDLMVRAQMLFNGKTSFTGGGTLADVGSEHRLSERNPTFRGNILVAEGTQSSVALLNQPDGVLLQDLPFSIELKKFNVDYYSTGMPKLFTSDIVIHDKVTGESVPARVEVNHPVNYKGVEIYQSSFSDGGSELKLKAIPLTSNAPSFEIEGVVGGFSELTQATSGKKTKIEYSELRLINVENFSDQKANTSFDVRAVDLRNAIGSRLGSAHKTVTQKEFRNVGPSVTYKLRDESGQANEFHNYMYPMNVGDGSAVFLLGVRTAQAENFKYLRIPADDQASLSGFINAYQALQDPVQRELAVRAYVANAVDAKREDLAAQLTSSASRILTLFAEGKDGNGNLVGGLQAISDFLELQVPETERNKAGEVLIRILNGTLFELVQQSRENAGKKPLERNPETLTFMTQAVLSLSDVSLYPVPIVFQLVDFKQVQASVFQVARAPGKNVVYLGCVLLIIGVFSMLYIRERRVWLWLAPKNGATHAVMAMSTNRKTVDGDRDFAQLAQSLIGANPIQR